MRIVVTLKITGGLNTIYEYYTFGYKNRIYKEHIKSVYK